MPNPLSPRDRLVSLFDSLLYAANHAFMMQQAGPRNRRRTISRRELVELLGDKLTPSVQVPTSPLADDRDLYNEMLSLIRSSRTSITDDFMQQKAATRKKFVDDFVEKTMHPMLSQELGCGDLCYEKDRGCVEC